MRKIINFIVFLLIGIFTASSQSNDYVAVDQAKVKKVIDDIIVENEGASPENKGWARQILQDAFDSYFSNNVINVDIDYINKKITKLESELRIKTDSIRLKEKRLKNLNGKNLSLNDRIKQLESENNTMSDSIKSLKKQLNDTEKEKSLLNNNITNLNNNLKIKTDSIATLKGSVKSVAKVRDLYVNSFNMSCDTTRELTKTIEELNNEMKDYKQLGNKLKSLEQNIENLCEKYDYIGGVNIDSINDNIEAYRGFVKFYSTGSSADYVKPEIQQKLDYLDVVIIAETFYQKAIKFMSDKYDARINEELIAEYNSVIINILEYLNKKQKDELQSLSEALRELPKAMEHFNTKILPYLKSFDLVATDGKAKHYKDEVIVPRIEEFSSMKQYNAYYVNLNNVLNDKVLGKLKRMDNVHYKEFLKNIEEAL